MKYHPNMSPRSLQTVKDGDFIRHFPKYWELMKWYLCWRKVPYQSEVIAALMVETRTDDVYSHYPCPLDNSHWHIGRGGGKTDPKRRLGQAKRTYRKAVRDEIWRAHVVRDEERTRAGV